ncbi:MAG: S1 RNA-binding domain-containing protein [Butyrivibrio sp.]|nr:S1 RNA-binding domain-containing protein [Butyrivibrio sp.]
MAKNEELLEQETTMESTTEQEPALPKGTETTQPTEDMDLNELLSSMDQPMETGETPPEEPVPAEEEPPVKPRRTSGRKKKAETTETAPETEESAAVVSENTEAAPLTEENSIDAAPDTDSTELSADTDPEPAVPTEDQPAAAPRPVSKAKTTAAPILTLESRSEIETDEAREDAIWHEIHNAYRTHRLLTGQLGGIEQTDSGKTIAIVDYKGFRIVIPLKEMMINVGRSPSDEEYRELMLRQNKILGNMFGAEIDFMVRGIDSKTRSVVASRKESMLKKRQIFYLDTYASDTYRIFEGRVVQARIIAVAEKVVRVEVFGVECSIMARDLAWGWIGDAHERFSVGDQILVRVLNVRRGDTVEDISTKADIKSVSQSTSHDNLKKCRIQSKYAGMATDVHKGVVYIRLSNGVNAVAHSCYDHRTPGKKDDVSFAVTRIDEERGVAVGIITRIIRQNL